MRSTSADLKMSDFVQSYVERDFADNIGLDELVSESALKPNELLL